MNRYRSVLRGEPLLIIGCGPSIDTLDLTRVQCNTLSLNGAHRNAALHLAIDPGQRRNVKGLHPLIGGWQMHPDVEIKAMPVDGWKWSDSLELGAHYCGSVMFTALQFAKWMGADQILIAGLDLTSGPDGRGHCAGHRYEHKPYQARHAKAQKGLMRLAAQHLTGRTVINLNPDSACDAFPKMTEREVTGAGGYKAKVALGEAFKGMALTADLE